MQSQSISPNMRRADAARYIREAHGIPCAPATLAKYACMGAAQRSARLANFRSTHATISMHGQSIASVNLCDRRVSSSFAGHRGLKWICRLNNRRTVSQAGTPG